ncbi:hypothetical protein GTP38_24640 [Duganella sp. FT94W]|uniref:DUF5625 domain-containing protein n=1 Tax=Duganella lactea TaxID=2692173 RepID=A0ABW9VD12_9BURK|nr:DUF5625 family protein [Duganella lactea]MYM37519.1 hypothetical protein [Duganella lactea]
MNTQRFFIGRSLLAACLLVMTAQAWAQSPLFEFEPVSLAAPGLVLTKSVDARQAWNYSLNLDFEFASNDAIFRDQVVGSRYDRNCGQPYDKIPLSSRPGLGRPMPFHVIVRRLDNQQTVLDRNYESLCLMGTRTSAPIKSRIIARIALQQGRYVIEVHNLAAQTGLEHIKTSISLTAGHGKW